LPSLLILSFDAQIYEKLFINGFVFFAMFWLCCARSFAFGVDLRYAR